MSAFDNATLMITGGTGSFGSTVLKHFLDSDLKEIRIFSRDEKKQDDMRHELQAQYPEYANKVKFYIGDVRNPQSIRDAMPGVNYIFHAAALKQVPSCEFFPMQAVQTNIIGTDNVLHAAIDAGVERVVCLSTDKAAYPINAMGISKAMMEHVIFANARVAAERGHKVTVLEKSDKLAGLLTMAQVLNANIEPLVSYWNEEMKLHPNIEIKLNTKVDVDTLRALNPDQVIVSPGGGIIPIDVPGIDGKNVVKSEDIKAMCNGIVPEGKGMIWKAAVAAIKAQGGTVGFMRMGLNMKSGPTAIVGKRVVVVGGGFAGLEVAEAMCDGREIWVIDPAKKLGNGIGIIDKNPTINLLKKKGVHLMPLTELIEVTKKGAKVKNVETGEEQLIECDTVLTSLGVEQNTDLYDEIVKVWPHAKLIGDATTPDGKVYRTLEAVKGGYQASMAI